MSKNHFTLIPIEENKTRLKIVGRGKHFANGVIQPGEGMIDVTITNYDYSSNYLKSKIREYLVNEEGITASIIFNLLQVNDPQNTLAFLDDGIIYDAGTEYPFAAGEKENYFVDGILSCDSEALDYDFTAIFVQTAYKFCRGIKVNYNVFEIG
ncbi:hypothetical protein MTsPCn5_28800 [Croceitalea sp. MTPC5]|uniref:hypothetical protein n=1 Tax=Croceitalea sp. MTPC5 TaxID=3056565 RepID=UPI002B3C3B27|nr:hypothetical protein MTsPCn5_28800 [Croceitalea sp. MTPC5]